MDVDDLYGAPLEQFVSARGALARELRKQGRREEAAEVASLRKPSVAAWAVNQLVRTQPRSISELFQVGDELQEAHRTAAAGRGDGGTLREAAQRERAAVEVLMEATRGLLTSEGHELSATIIERVADTLRAAALDSDARASVSHGRLERELRHVGLGVIDAGAATAPPRQSTRARAPKRPAPEPERDQARSQESERRERAERREEDKRREREHAQARKAAREIEAKARRSAERAARAVRVAEERRDRAAQDLKAAEESLSGAREAAEAAATELQRAHDELERI
jgi:hypothetical protein